MRVERPEAIEALKQYLLSNTAYPFLVAANSSADLKALTRSLPTRVHTISMSDTAPMMACRMKTPFSTFY